MSEKFSSVTITPKTTIIRNFFLKVKINLDLILSELTFAYGVVKR